MREGLTAYCGQCGNPVQTGDRFCGTCGAAVLAPPSQAEQVIPRSVAAAQSSATRSRKPFLLAAVVGALAVLLVGGGALALVGLNGTNLLGGAEQNPPSSSDNQGVAPSQPETTQEPASPASPTPSASASSSSSEEAQLEQFGREYDEAARREDWEAIYSMLDESSQQKITEQEWADMQQALLDVNGTPAPLESVSVQPNEQMSDSPATVTLDYEDGTQETMKAMIPMVVESGSDFSAKRYLTDQEISDLRHLSSVPPESTTYASPESTTGSYGQSTKEIEADAEQAAGDYYRAVGAEDWDYTYDHLDSETRSVFTREEWFKKNRWLAGDGSTIYHILSVDLDSSSGGPTAAVVVRLTFGDGSSSTRNTYFVYEDGAWKHRFSQEEYDLLLPDATYEKFVEAQQ